jgi:N-acetylmuramoyl-L-alanine amidase
MFQTNTINMSKIYAETLIKHLNEVNSLKHEVVQEAPFRVLKLPDIPAVLIETAYISNAREESLLKKNHFQKTLATAISSSIQDYFDGTDKPPGTGDEMKTAEYSIKKGDTLFSIAKKANTELDVLLKLNNLKREDTVYIGQEILIPAEKTADEDEDEDTDTKSLENKKKLKIQKKPLKYYTVKKGDTLFLVAKNHSTTLAELLKINNMKITDPLLYGQKIKIPLND